MQIPHMVHIIHIIKPLLRVPSIIIQMPWIPLATWLARQPVQSQKTIKMELKHTIGWKFDEIHQKQPVSFSKISLNSRLGRGTTLKSVSYITECIWLLSTQCDKYNDYNFLISKCIISVTYTRYK